MCLANRRHETIQTYPFLDFRDRGIVHSANKTKQSQCGDGVLHRRILGRRLGAHATNGGDKLSNGINAARKHCTWNDSVTIKDENEIRQRAVEIMRSGTFHIGKGGVKTFSIYA